MADGPKTIVANELIVPTGQGDVQTTWVTNSGTNLTFQNITQCKVRIDQATGALKIAPRT